MKLVLSGGGTGGHIYPALAVAKQCLAENPDTEIMYMGSEKGLEKDIVTRAGLTFIPLDVSGFRRKLSMDNMKTIIRFWKATRRSRDILKEFQPDVVVGTGGYVCGPVVYAAARLRIPTIIHEQNVIPGLTNKFLSRYADLVAVSFRGSETYFPKARKVQYTGNPRATEVAMADPDQGRKSFGMKARTPFIVIFGGSRGAKAINEAVLTLISQIKGELPFQMIYITGQIYYDEIRSQLEEMRNIPTDIHVVPYVDNMPELLAAASLVVGRAGASSLAELTALGLPSILIPSPNVTNNHQEANGRWLANEGAAIMVLEEELTGEYLLEKIMHVMSDPIRREYMSQQSLKMGEPDAAKILYNEIHMLMGDCHTR